MPRHAITWLLLLAPLATDTHLTFLPLLCRLGCVSRCLCRYKTCKESYTLRHGSQLLVITVGTNDGIRLDLDTMYQQPVR